MATVLIVIHLMVVVALIALILLQRSEGGALGIGGGGGGGFMSARGAANVLTRSTAFLAAAFFATSVALTILANFSSSPTDVLDQVPITDPAQGEKKGEGVLDLLAPKDAGKKEPAANNQPADTTQVPTGN